jgi:branched-chain amino acid transport system ATP-binding protein
VSDARQQALSIESLEVRRGGQPVLRGLDLSLDAGTSLAILGRNGAGKSTLAQTIAGLLSPSAGRISIFGTPTSRLAAHKVSKLDVALVPEGRALFSNMTVYENLAMGAHKTSWWWGGPSEDAFETVWTIFPALTKLKHRKAGTLSGGEQQMVAVGRALMSSPRLLVLDEPSAGLSPLAIQGMSRHLDDLRGAGYSILLIEQNADLALEVCDEIAILAQGTIVTRGDTDTVSRERVFVEALFGDVAPIEAAGAN